MSVVIKAEGIGKKYIIDHKASKRNYSTLRESLYALLKKSDNTVKEEFWALKDVDFEINQGDKIGIIGRNGAGKSTLLKILSRITEPTTGRIGIKGRVASLLEVGTGFHAELTGRENIFLNGSILGMTHKEIKKKFDEIVEFSGVENFLDTPVKRYSSGMYVRLAFSVAAHLETDILLVDEVLAVGDSEFQKKCLGKMDDISTSEGRTIFFVSHNMGAVKKFCDKGIYINKGRIIYNGDCSSTINSYLKDLSNTSTQRVEFNNNSDNSPIKLLEATILPKGKDFSDKIDTSDILEVSILFDVLKELKGVNLCIALRKEGILIFKSFDTDYNNYLLESRKPGKYSTKIRFPEKLLTKGIYTIDISSGYIGLQVIENFKDSLQFEIESINTHTNNSSSSSDSLINLSLKWEYQ